MKDFLPRKLYATYGQTHLDAIASMNSYYQGELECLKMVNVKHERELDLCRKEHQRKWCWIISEHPEDEKLAHAYVPLHLYRYAFYIPSDSVSVLIL
jgi:hypothetical protein